MKNVVGILGIFFLAIACQENEQVSESVGNQCTEQVKISNFEPWAILKTMRRRM